MGLPVGYTTVSCSEIKCDHNFAVSSIVRLAQGFGGRHVEGNTRIESFAARQRALI